MVLDMVAAEARGGFPRLLLGDDGLWAGTGGGEGHEKE